MNTAVSLKNKEASILKELIPQRHSSKVTIFHTFAKKRVIQYNLHASKTCNISTWTSLHWEKEIIMWKIKENNIKIPEFIYNVLHLIKKRGYKQICQFANYIVVHIQ